MNHKPLTGEQAKAQLRRCGITLREFAQSKGYPVAQVYAVTAGRVKGTRGRSHEIALALGMK